MFGYEWKSKASKLGERIFYVKNAWQLAQFSVEVMAAEVLSNWLYLM